MNSIIKPLCFVILSLISAGTVAQVDIKEQPEVEDLMDRFVKLGKEEPYIDGWRIKIISTTNRRALENARNMFRRNYAGMTSSWSHESPHYSLVVGAFERRLDLEPLLVRFKKDFPTAIPYRDRIMKTELFLDNGY